MTSKSFWVLSHHPSFWNPFSRLKDQTISSTDNGCSACSRWGVIEYNYISKLPCWLSAPKDFYFEKFKSTLGYYINLMNGVSSIQPNCHIVLLHICPQLRCQTSPSIGTLGGDQPVIPRVTFIRWVTTFPHSIVRSLRPTFVSARLVCLTVKLPFAFALKDRFLTDLRKPLYASVTFWEATAPVKLPTWNCLSTGLRYEVRILILSEWYLTNDSILPKRRISPSPTYSAQIKSKSNFRIQ